MKDNIEVVWDTETTGFRKQDKNLSRREQITNQGLVELGAVKLKNGKAIEKFHTFVDPKMHIEDEWAKLYGIGDKEMAEMKRKGKARPLSKVLRKFHEFVQGSTMIAHNGNGFDVPLMKACYKRQFGRSQDPKEQEMANDPFKNVNRLVDSLGVARSKYPGKRNTLDALCKRFNVDLSEREADGHGAYLDSVLLAKVYNHMMPNRQKKFEHDYVKPKPKKTIIHKLTQMV